MLYALYNPDGSIHQSNKVYDWEADEALGKKSYDAVLQEQGRDYVKVLAPGILQPEYWYVDVKAKELCERPDMEIDYDKLVIKCGDKDSALFTGIIKGSKYKILSSGIEIYSGVLDGNELEISIPVPCLYELHIDYWPYKTFIATIEAVA